MRGDAKISGLQNRILFAIRKLDVPDSGTFSLNSNSRFAIRNCPCFWAGA